MKLLLPCLPNDRTTERPMAADNFEGQTVHILKPWTRKPAKFSINASWSPTITLFQDTVRGYAPISKQEKHPKIWETLRFSLDVQERWNLSASRRHLADDTESHMDRAADLTHPGGSRAASHYHSDQLREENPWNLVGLEEWGLGRGGMGVGGAGWVKGVGWWWWWWGWWWNDRNRVHIKSGLYKELDHFCLHLHFLCGQALFKRYFQQMQATPCDMLSIKKEVIQAYV